MLLHGLRMSKHTKKVARKTGVPAGTVLPTEDFRTKPPKITVIDYDEKTYSERVVDTIEECFSYKDTPTVTWINIDGLQDSSIIEKIGKQYDIHPLVLEDVSTIGQRPKCEDYDTYMFAILNMLFYNNEEDNIRAEQISILFGSCYVISFQETIGDVFDVIRERIRNGKGRIRKLGPDYLAYSLIDAIVDNYFVILENVGEYIEVLDKELVQAPSPDLLMAVYELKGEILFLRKSVWPLREVIGKLQKSDSELLSKTTTLYVSDVYDHTIQIIDSIETFRDIATGMLDVYLSSVSHKMNEVMKVLTIISTIFIPLTFITGIYGMNFNTDVSRFNMPELNWPFGYCVAVGLMLFVALTMVIYFKKKKWF